jgi:hypothetical protein
MAVINFNADSTSLILNGTGILDFASGDVLELAPVNPVTSHVNGSGGGVAISKRSDGGVHDLTIRVLQATDADIFLNTSQEQETPVIFSGSIKENFVKDGNDGVDSFLLENGSFTDRPTITKNDLEGNKLVEYKIRFRNCVRAI